MLGHRLTSIFVLMGAGLVAAQIPSIPTSISSTCSTTLKGLLNDPEAECLNISAFSTFLIDPEQSIPRTVNTWLTGLCSVGSCSDQTIANIIRRVTESCAEDFSNENIDILGLQDKIIGIAQRVYPTVRNVVCLKDTTSNNLCVTQTLNSLEQVIGQLGVEDLSFVNLNDDVQTLIASNVTELACTSCIKAGYTIIKNDFPDQVTFADAADSHVENLCGASFLDGVSPSEVSETAVSGQYVASTNAGSSGKSLLKGSWVLMLASTFIVFAA